ncbi:hypothetical protein [Corynebacterium meitnerae]|uniref:Uncharacterized protein n=1 Tax=Corynebacterium meitnerae TaxID=2913498 RepID=A0A9X3LW09_9CORY|nr:hypothetical protein [Corynebacterium meitnerae]MCZ9293543.1 hypothetical protein [Corynebacterium meitnerae]
MFSLFKKKQTTPSAPATPATPAPDFDFLANVPPGWELLIDGENPTPWPPTPNLGMVTSG